MKKMRDKKLSIKINMTVYKINNLKYFIYIKNKMIYYNDCNI